jgi:glyoxylase-like metal-dependent hydrolase (beta-lactamase superfamily II)
MEVAPGVYSIERVRMAHAYLVEGDGLTLIDTGMRGSGETVLNALAALGRRISTLRHIVISHHHFDHTGSLARLAELTKATVSVHKADAPYVRGDLPRPPFIRAGFSGWFMRPFMGLFPIHPEPCQVDAELEDGEEIEAAGGLKVIHAPGHTPGHIALLLPSKRILFAGDAVLNVLGLRPPLAMATPDMAQAKESIRKLAALDFDIACFGHGGIMRKDAVIRFRRFAEKLR